MVDDIKLALLGDNGSSCSYQGRLSGGDGDAGGDGMKEHWKPVKYALLPQLWSPYNPSGEGQTGEEIGGAKQ